MERLWRGARNVSCGSIATETRCPNYVRSSLDSDLIAGALTRLKSANFLIMHRKTSTVHGAPHFAALEARVWPCEIVPGVFRRS